ncbi:cold shock domain-containing protein [Candidatus Woesearchaeota archaeon]|jgi:cold shock protein|nr:cold shock domain-containing protein [Candidatus Woesearchaeota archaeon]MBT5740404.1 cold shock domain-containing protein [Candidatus Woesearchaeota archaeon]
MQGKVKFYNEQKGFGFVTAEDGKDYFVHQSALGAGVRLRENDVVTFDVEQGDRGLKAVNVSLGGEEAAPAAEEEPAQEEAPVEEESTEEEAPAEEPAQEE